MQKSEIIITQKLILRPFSKEIVNNNYLNWLNDKEITSYLEINGDYSIEMLNNYVDSMINNKVLIWSIYIKNCNKHIGNIKIDPINFKHGLGEYGRWAVKRNGEKVMLLRLRQKLLNTAFQT